ncbi:MAG: SUMF1/EgtB/PvdO family nonheme iron enzyme [Candidatus Accumulibacter sp.]|uniref:formylglycine-generating enzyme family protein n=1 Tax=Accumulibacter sp. TaxID=2053492 RepID=UPI00287B03A5|nr:SUMF1/EgtB/PvdO family nonheme iron enzyme [Accumulibacter sp.]MDS4014385.1 SUMF1/EgtB/PvdO family nonheme iron enzyme [Accumulibacter sp.]
MVAPLTPSRTPTPSAQSSPPAGGQAASGPHPGAGRSARRTILLPDIDWVEIPGGEFLYQKGERRRLETFRIARYPVTNVQYQTFIDDGGYADDRWWKDLKRPQPESSHWPQANRPRTNVNQYEAVAFTRWLSARFGYAVRLPSESEWERAARGRDGRAYPWGETYESGRANIDETAKYFGSEHKVGEWTLEQTTAVGVYPHGASPEGVLDLSGNVWEWCLEDSEKSVRGEMSLPNSAGVVRGCCWGNDADDARASGRDWLDPDDRFLDVGFRVLSSAPIS